MFCAMDWRDHRFVEMAAHPVEIGVRCGCTRVLAARPAYFIAQLGEAATPRDAERRMLCRACGARAQLSLGLIWSVSGGRDMRRDPPPLPEWMGLCASGSPDADPAR